MNRKKMVAIVAAVVILIAVIALAVQPKQMEKQPEATETAPEQMYIAVEENKDSATSENNQNHEGSAENTEEKKTSENNTERVDNSADSNSESATGETKPQIPEENVQLGVVESDADPNIDEDDDDMPAQNGSGVEYTPTEPKQEQVEEQELPADFDITKLTYEQYNAMSGAQQRQVIEMFASPEEFMKWYRAVEAQYKAEHPDIEIGADGVIDAEDLIK